MPGIGLGIGPSFVRSRAGSGELSYDRWLKSLEPVAFFRMADAGTTMVDEMGNITTGVHDAANLVAPPIPTSAGAHAYFGSADAKSSHFTSTADLEVAEFTTALWFQFPTGAAIERSVLDAFNGSFTHGHGIWVNHVNGGSLDFYRGNGSGAHPIPGGVVPRDTPLRIVCVQQGSTSRIYVNGVEASSGTIPGSTYYPVPTGLLIEIGSEKGDLFIEGLIWDVVFFDYPWDADTVAEDYARGIATP